MGRSPAEIAERIRAQRRFLQRIVFVTFPIALVGMGIMVVAQPHVSKTAINLVIVPTVIAFFAAWFSILALWLLGFRDLRNMFRPGSADAYEKDRK